MPPDRHGQGNRVHLPVRRHGRAGRLYTAFRIPNLLRDLFAEGALSQSYTSVASKTREAEGDAAAWELTNKVATQLSTLMVAIVTLGILFAGPIMEALYSGDHSVTGSNCSPRI